MDRVSVIIPLYNQAQFVGQAIDSALGQTYKNIEVIVIDDGSKDNPQQALAPYLREKKIRYVYQENKGLSAARNRGIKEAQGTFIKFLDSDDFLYPQQIERQVMDISGEPKAMSVTDYHDLRPNGRMVRRHLFIERRKRQLASFIMVNQVVVHSFLTPRALVEEAGGFDESLSACEDWDLWLRILKNGGFIKHIPESGCCYRISSASMSADMARMFAQECRVIEKVSRWLKLEEELPSFMKDYCLQGSVRLIEEAMARRVDPQKILSNTFELTDLFFRERKKGMVKVLYDLLGIKKYTWVRFCFKKIKDHDYEYKLLNMTNIHRYGEQFHKQTPYISRLSQTAMALKNKGIILMYHRVTHPKPDPWELNVVPQHFEEQMRVLKKLADVVPLSAAAKNIKRVSFGPKTIAVTFDDGYSDNFHHARPILEKYQIPATFFVISSAVGSRQAFWWEELQRALYTPHQLPPLFQMTIAGIEYNWLVSPKETRIYFDDIPPVGIMLSRSQLCFALWEILNPLSMIQKREYLRTIMAWTKHNSSACQEDLPLDLDQLIALSRSPYVDIGAHARTHPLLSRLSRQEQEEEITDSKQHLEKMLQRPVTAFSYPHGDCSPVTVELVKGQGFELACGTQTLPVRRNTDVFNLPRFNVLNWDGREFEKRVVAWLNQS